jgi:hypothetical protein
MFRLLGVILRPSIEPNQDYLITRALWDPVALTIGGVNAVWNYSLVFKMAVGSAGTGLFCGCNDGFVTMRRRACVMHFMVRSVLCVSYRRVAFLSPSVMIKLLCSANCNGNVVLKNVRC